MKKNLYIHLGMHKTGSTSIQVALYKNQEVLKKLGYLYPESGRPENARFGHHSVAWSFVENKEWIPQIKGIREPITENLVLKDLIEEIDGSQCDNVILSSEEFDILSENELESLFDFFAKFNVVPIMYVRNTVDFIESSYKTSVFYSGYTKTIDEFYANQRSRLDTFKFVSELFFKSKQQLILKNYDVIKESNNLITDFIESIGINSNELSYSDNVKENKSPPSEVLEIIRFFNAKQVDFPTIQSALDKLMVTGKEKKVHLLRRAKVAELDDDYHSFLEKVSKLLEASNNSFPLSTRYFERSDNLYLDDNLVKSILFVISAFDTILSRK